MNERDIEGLRRLFEFITTNGVTPPSRESGPTEAEVTACIDTMELQMIGVKG